MGCQTSSLAASKIDDSIHAMLEHDRKIAAKKGQQLAISYVPRQPHPMLKPVYCSEDETISDTLSLAFNEQSEEILKVETAQFLFHTKNRTHSVDKRDIKALNHKSVHVIGHH
jgi:hypothetical protein